MSDNLTVLSDEQRRKAKSRIEFTFERSISSRAVHCEKAESPMTLTFEVIKTDLSAVQL